MLCQSIHVNCRQKVSYPRYGQSSQLLVCVRCLRAIWTQKSGLLFDLLFITLDSVTLLYAVALTVAIATGAAVLSKLRTDLRKT